MKRFTLLLAIAIMSCSAALAQNVSEKMNFTNFTSIDAEYAYQINVTKGSSNTIEVIYPERLKEHLKIFVSGETLNLSTNFPKKDLWIRGMDLKDDEKIIVNVEMEEIKSLYLSGAASLRANGVFQTKNFKLSISGAVKIEDVLYINAETFAYSISGASEASVSGNFTTATGHISGASEFELNGSTESLSLGCSGASETQFNGSVSNKASIECSGASEVTLTGNCSTISIQCSGASEVDAEDMKSLNATATASGASFIKVHADETLTLKTSGGSKIRYYGKGKYVPQESPSSPIARGK